MAVCVQLVEQGGVDLERRARIDARLVRGGAELLDQGAVQRRPVDHPGVDGGLGELGVARLQAQVADLGGDDAFEAAVVDRGAVDGGHGAAGDARAGPGEHGQGRQQCEEAGTHDDGP